MLVGKLFSQKYIEDTVNARNSGAFALKSCAFAKLPIIGTQCKDALRYVGMQHMNGPHT